MSFVLKPFKIIKTNWKKSIFFGCASAYAIDYVKGLYQDTLLRRSYCSEALKYGQQLLPLGNVPARVTVFLNPAVRGGKGVKLFDRNVAPILHLAGFEVTIIKTEYEGQIKKYMDVLEKTDAIIVAGGNGSLLEVITGLLRRKDSEEFCKIPIGVIPLGSTNSLSKILHVHGDSDVHWLLEAAMSIVLNKFVSKDVMEIKSEKGNIYALDKLRWGLYRDAEANVNKYWYFGPLKHRWTYIKETFGEWPKVFKAKLQYTKPCEGCKNCFQMPSRPSWKWWHAFIPPKYKVPLKDYSTVVNNECGKPHEQTINLSDLTISLNNKPFDEDKALDIQFLSKKVDKMDFVKEGWNRMNNKHSVGISLKQLLAEKVNLEPEQKDTWYTIDNEDFEAMPVEISLLRNRLIFYCSKENSFIH